MNNNYYVLALIMLSVSTSAYGIGFEMRSTVESYTPTTPLRGRCVAHALTSFVAGVSHSVMSEGDPSVLAGLAVGVASHLGTQSLFNFHDARLTFEKEGSPRGIRLEFNPSFATATIAASHVVGYLVGAGMGCLMLRQKYEDSMSGK